MGKRLENKVAWVTGSSRGIGRVVASHLAGLGANVVVHGTTPTSARQLNEADSLDAVAAEIAAEHDADVLAVHGDLTDAETAENLVAEIHGRFGRIDILINNAGFGIHKSFSDLPLDSIEGMVRTNFLGAVYCIKEVLPSMIERRSGHIVNISSVSGKIGFPNVATYSATKFALGGLSESLYHELRPLGIHVSVVCPGPVRTKFHLHFDDIAPKAPAFLVLNTDVVSRVVIQAIVRKKFEVVIPLWLAWVCFFKRLMPNFFRWISYQALRKRSIRQIR